MRFRTAVLAASLLCIAGLLGAQKRFTLTIDNIMRGHELAGYEPQSPRWSGDSQKIYFEWKQRSGELLKPLDTYVVNRDGSGLKRLTDEEKKLVPPPSGGGESKDHARTVYVRDGDIFINDHKSGITRQITKTADIESNPQFARDGKRVWFTRANNLYLLSLDDGRIEQLTDIQTAGQGAAPSAEPAQGRRGAGSAAERATGDQKGTASQEWLKKEERDLFDVIRQKEKLREEEEARKERENPRKPFKLEPRQTVASLELSPDEKIVMARIMEPGQGAKTTIVPNFVTASGYTEDINSRGKVGDVQARVRLALIGVADGGVKWVDHGQKTPATPEKQLAQSKDQEKAAAAEEKKPPTAERDRDIVLLRPVWSEDGARCLLMGRSTDNKDRWIFALDPATGKTRVIAEDHDDAWVDGPGAFTLGWMKNDHEIYFQSERSGYSHLYVVPYEGGEARPLTSGKWEVQSARLSLDKTHFYLTTNEGDPAQVNLYSMPASGGPRTRITSLPGGHRAVVSPDDQWVADIYSYTNKPPELFVMANRPGSEERKLTDSPAPEFWTYPWIDTPIVHFKARDGVLVPAHLYKPANYQRGGPAVIFVHGAGYLQNVHRWWSSYFREYMFHHFLMEHGFVVMDVDYRGSAGYGRDWRTAIYRHMGGIDLTDQVDAAQWLVREQGVDPKRIGIYGGSYGGFITLMAMFTQPDVFAAGAALRPVSDWAHYNNGYTSNILNTPQKDAEAYKESSPIFFAGGLKGALLICHGMVDTNVHFQDTVRLVQKLIELRKENWELAVFPVEDHGFVQPTSWADEYKRIFHLFEKNL
jgi:dipeptidyl aminopeptidase/acylaminoacyl peptidase